jgi:zinc protease
MHSLLRVLRSFACLVTLAPLVIAPPLAAQTVAPLPQAQDETPWLYRNSDVPRDPDWNFGELDNGLRYAVRRNAVPPGQVSIRVLMDVGSLHERPEESGFAHLLEHLVFRQSRHLGPAQAIPAWQRLGATFGSDTNAETSPTQTVYKIDLPEATPAKLDEAFKLLSGMVIAPVLSEANVRAEVPIVLAEMRERGGAGARVADATRETLYAGQPLADHTPIGTVETLTGANQANVGAFHARWYRPDNAVIVAAGDIDPALLAGLVRKWFGDWPAKGPRVPPPSFGDPKAPAGAVSVNGTPLGETRVIVEPDLPREITWAILRPWRPVDDTIEYNQGLMIDSLAQAIINRRLEARARAGGSYLAAGVRQQDTSRSVDATYVSITPIGDDWRAAVRDVRAVIADALATPPSQAEIAREVAEMNVIFESQVEQARLRSSAKLADDIVGAVDIRETVASPQVVHRVFRDAIPLYTPQAVLKHTRQLFTGTVSRAVYITPQSDGDAAALRQAMAAPIKADGRARPEGKPVSFAALPAIGKPGKAMIVQSGLQDIEQLDFGNGVKALIYPTIYEPGRVFVKVRWGRGYGAFGPGDAPYIALGETALVGSGVGPLGQEELDRISTGRKMGFEFKIDDTDFTFSADTRMADLADQLYLFAAKFAMPRWDANPVLRAKAAARLQYEIYSTSPQGVLQRDLKYYQRGLDPRYHAPTPAELDAVTPQGFREVWQPILESGPIEVQVYGDIDRAQTIAALEKTFGALPKRAPLQSAAPVLNSPEPSSVPVVLNHRGDANQAAAYVSWPTGGGMDGVHESRRLYVLSQVFSNRLLDAMREQAGASYAPQVYADWPLDSASGGSIFALAQLQPAAVPDFFETVDAIAADLAANPPSAEEMSLVVEPLRQQLTRAASGSAFIMNQLEGATYDPSRFAAVGSILSDYTRITPAEVQQLAQRYLVKDKSWRMAVIPQGQALAGAGRTNARR